MAGDRHMFGWDLPPGVSLHHIPGNRPEDLEDEAFWEEILKQFEIHGVKLPVDVLDSEWYTRSMEICRDMAFNRGYKQGQSDEKWTNDMAQEPVLGHCPHGIDLDRAICPDGCRV